MKKMQSDLIFAQIVAVIDQNFINRASNVVNINDVISKLDHLGVQCNREKDQWNIHGNLDEINQSFSLLKSIADQFKNKNVNKISNTSVKDSSSHEKKSMVNVGNHSKSSLQRNSPQIENVNNNSKTEKAKQKSKKCVQCEKTFTSQSNLGHHIRSIHEKERIGCPSCDKQFSTRTELNRHYSVTHDKSEYPCSFCDLVLPNCITLKKHQQRVHKQVAIDQCFSCDVCGEAFLYRTNLLRHIRTLHQGRRYNCPKCDLKFSTKFQVDVHVSTDHDGKFFKCEHCDQPFRKKINLASHLENQHPVFTCMGCKATLYLKSKIKHICSPVRKRSQENISRKVINNEHAEPVVSRDDSDRENTLLKAARSQTGIGKRKKSRNKRSIDDGSKIHKKSNVEKQYTFCDDTNLDVEIINTGRNGLQQMHFSSSEDDSEVQEKSKTVNFKSNDTKLKIKIINAGRSKPHKKLKTNDGCIKSAHRKTNSTDPKNMKIKSINAAPNPVSSAKSPESAENNKVIPKQGDEHTVNTKLVYVQNNENEFSDRDEVVDEMISLAFGTDSITQNLLEDTFEAVDFESAFGISGSSIFSQTGSNIMDKDDLPSVSNKIPTYIPSKDSNIRFPEDILDDSLLNNSAHIFLDEQNIDNSNVDCQNVSFSSALFANILPFEKDDDSTSNDDVHDIGLMSPFTTPDLIHRF